MSKSASTRSVLLFFVVCFWFLVMPTMSFSAWTIEEVDARSMFSLEVQMGIAVDGSNRPHIAYGGGHLYHAYFNGVQWKYEVVDNALAGDASIAVDAGGKVHISYLGRGALRHATNVSGSWVTSAIDSAGNVGRYNSIVVDAGGKVHISYLDYTNLDLKYATNVSGSWVTSIIDSTGNVGWWTSIAVDTGGKVHISYVDNTNDDLKYATNVSGSWVTSAIDSAGYVGFDTSIAVDAGGKVHISYFDRTNHNLKYATNASDSWVTSAIDSVWLGGEYASIAVDAGGKVHISYLGRGALRHATNVSGSWVTSIIDSADNVGWRASIAVDTGGKVHISYFDWTNDDLKYATNASGSWVTSAIDRTGSVGVDTSIAVDAGGKVHISYLDWRNDVLRYATNASGSWITSAIDSAGNDAWDRFDTSIAVDAGGKVHISYVDPTNDNLRYATNASGSWVTSTIDSAGDVGWYASTSIAVDAGGKVHISYYDGTDYDLKYATNASGPWVTSIIDSAGDVGLFTSIAVDTGGKVHISYLNIGYLGYSGLKYATNASGLWVTSTIDSVGNAWWGEWYASIAVDAGGKVHISYLDGTDYDLKYATNASGSWVTSTIDSAGDVGLFTSIAVDAGGKVHIGYFDNTNDDLKYATNASGSWRTSIIDSTGNVGWWTSIAVDTGGKVHISYLDYTNLDLKYATNNAYVKVCSDNVCVEFPQDTEPPDLTVTSSPDNPGPEQGDFQVIGIGGDPMYYDISTNPPYSGSMKVCINYDDTGLSLDQEQNLKIKHWDGLGWNDATCAPLPPNPNTDANIICACVDHLSWFAIGYEVSAGAVTLTLPNGGEIIPSGSIYTIQWAAPSNAVKFDLKYSLNNGTTWKTIATEITGTSYNWTVPVTFRNKIKCLVKVIGYDAAGVKVGEDTSDSQFIIEEVKVTSPDGGEILESGKTWNITWRTNATISPVAKSYIYYTTGGGIWKLITTRIGNSGSYLWEVPWVSSAKCKVKVVLKDATGRTVGSDVSDRVFTIKPVPIPIP